MNHFKIITAAVVIMMISFSCRKQSVTPQPVITAKKLQKIEWVTSYPLTQNYFYDAEGRLIKYEDNYLINMYTFGINTVAIKEFRKSENRFVADATGVTDDAGRVINLNGNYSYNINYPYTEQTAFIYDAEGYLKQFTRTAGAIIQTYDYTVTNGDYSKLVYQKTNSGGYTQVTDMYTDKNDLSGVGSIELSIGNHTGLFGKLNKHLIKSKEITQQNAPTPSSTYMYTYTLDSNGYIQTFEQTGTTGATGTYTFQ